MSLKTLTFLSAYLAVAACSSDEGETPADPVETGETLLSETAIGDIAGTYEIKLPDGSVSMQTIKPDGTYVETTDNGAETGRGIWRATDNGEMCFDPDGATGEECYAGGAPDDDGTFEMRGENGEVTSTVRKIVVPTGAGMTTAE